MKAEYSQLKHGFGEIRLFPENLDDLWHLEHLVRPGDLVFATTFRSIESSTDKIRPEKMEKKPFRLGIRVDKVEFHRNANRIRVSGVIEHGLDTGLFHTLNVEAGYEISVIKTWNQRDLERVERAVKSSILGAIHILSVEEGEAQIFRLRQFGPQHVMTLTGGSGKREGKGGRELFFEEIAHQIRDISGPFVIAGPGFVKDEFYAFLMSRQPDFGDRCILAETRSSGRGAVQEVIGQGILQRITDDIQLTREVRLMEELLKRIGTDGAAAYGVAEVREGIGYGAAEKILVTDEMVHHEDITSLLEEGERVGASIVIFSTEFDPGIQLQSLGGIAALLRFSLKK